MNQCGIKIPYVYHFFNFLLLISERLMTVLDSIKPDLLNRVDNADPGEPMSIKLDRYIKKYLSKYSVNED